jgi:hypothetical protein
LETAVFYNAVGIGFEMVGSPVQIVFNDLFLILCCHFRIVVKHQIRIALISGNMMTFPIDHFDVWMVEGNRPVKKSFGLLTDESLRCIHEQNHSITVYIVGIVFNHLILHHTSAGGLEPTVPTANACSYGFFSQTNNLQWFIINILDGLISLAILFLS